MSYPIAIFVLLLAVGIVGAWRLHRDSVKPGIKIRLLVKLDAPVPGVRCVSIMDAKGDVVFFTYEYVLRGPMTTEKYRRWLRQEGFD